MNEFIHISREKFSQRSKEIGQGLVEYALVMMLVAVVSILALMTLGGFAQIEYRVLHGTIVCAPEFAADKPVGEMFFVNGDGDCASAPKTSLSWNADTRELEADSSAVTVYTP